MIASNRIETEQINLLYQHASMVLIGAALMGAALVMVFWQEIPWQASIAWFAVLMATTVLRLLMVSRYHARAESSDRALHWAKWFSWTAAISGIVWGIGYAMFFLPDEPLYVLFSACMYVGMVSAATLSLTAYMPAYYAFVFPATLPVSIRTLLEGGDIYPVLGLSYLLYLGVSIFFGNNLNRMIVGSIRLRFENIDLLDDLKVQKDNAEESRRTAEQAVLAKNRFLAAASHDLRQPLHALGLFFGALKQHVSGQEGRTLLEKIDRSSSALNHIFNSLLDVSRLDAGVVEINKRHIQLPPLLEAIHAEYLPAATDRGLRFHCLDCVAVAYTDPILLERIVRNLVSNAVNYTRHGSVELRCRRLPDGMLSIDVTDTGIGIPDAEIGEIFSEYHQINNPERDRSKGLGLGLAIVKRLSELLDVKVDVTSEPGRGTRFSVILPPGNPDLVEDYNTQRPPLDVSGTVVLVIDDDRDILDGMQRLLSGWGCTPILAGSAEEATQRILAEDIVPDVLFVDYRLRDNMTGIDALRIVSEELNTDLPAVIITGDTSEDRLQEASAHGLSLLHKPVNPAEVRVALHQALAGDQARKPRTTPR